MKKEKKLLALKERAKRMKVDFVDLKEYEVDPSLAEGINSAFARQVKAVPISLDGDTLVVAMEDPTDLYIIEQLEIRTRKKIKPVLADSEDIQHWLNMVYGEITPEDIRIPIFEEKDFQQVLKIIDPDTISWLKSTLANALRREASDIHIEPHEGHLLIRYRIDGVISESVRLPRNMEAQIDTLIKSIAKMKLEKRNIPQRGVFPIFVNMEDLMVRVGSLPTKYGERFILRIMDKRHLIRDLDSLGLEKDDLERLKNLVEHRQGLIVISGPSGSGISTTLYSIINYIKNPKINVITIEDPIEAPLQGVNQVEINEKVNLGYAQTIAAVLSHDPDVIMVGRVKDQEAAKEIIEAALRGKRIFAGFYARGAINTITRFRDFGIEPYFVSSALEGVISRRLARTVCPYCAESVEPSEDLLWELKSNGIEEPYSVRVGRGCNKCMNTGYKGRVGIYEILPISESLRGMILRDASKERLREQAIRDGMRTLYQDGLIKVAKGLITFEELKRVLME